MKTLKIKIFAIATALFLISSLYLYEKSIVKTQKEEIKSQNPNIRVANYAANYKENEMVFLKKGIDWLVSVQFENGGWGAGTHADQGNIDARNVQIDPGTTAFAAMALLRSGNTLTQGEYSQNLNKALLYLLDIVEKVSENGNKITDISGTQPQIKLGENIDATLCLQFLIRILPHTQHDKILEQRVNAAMDKCLRKIQKSQSADGGWNDGGWAPVLQSAMANNALEQAYNMGRNVDGDALKKSRDYQRGNIDTKTGGASTERSAGVELYSISSGQRASALEARKAKDLVEKAKADGLIDKNAEINEITLGKIMDKEEAKTLNDAFQQNKVSMGRMQDDDVLNGFGNNGGEEFLSFMMTSESLVITGGEDWSKWKEKMSDVLQKIQNQDGSWNGHHCITSPVFCTAAVILSLTVEQDLEVLMKEKQEKKDK